MNITVLDGYGLNPGDLSWEGLEKLGNLKVYDRTAPDQVIERSRGCEIILTNKTIVNEESINSLPKLKYIGVLATGYNVVDITAASRKGVVVTNIPSYSTMSVAQRVFSLLLTVTDRAEHYACANREGAWARSRDFCWWDTELTELAGKKFGIIGYGNIGKAVAAIAIAFGMDVLAVTSKESNLLVPGVTKVSREELFSNSDIISLHCPLTETTKGIINSTSISKMKPGVIIINTGRGPLVDEEAVAEGLASGKIRAFCADVLSTEPPSSDNILLRCPGAYITPHIGWATKEARIRLMNIAVENIKSFLSGEPTNVVSARS